MAQCRLIGARKSRGTVCHLLQSQCDGMRGSRDVLNRDVLDVSCSEKADYCVWRRDDLRYEDTGIPDGRG